MIKRALILARQFEQFDSIAHRVRALFFLATPHRGADIAQLLTKILDVGFISVPFVTDLHRNSLATQAINDEFPQHCQNLQLYSFFETIPTRHVVGKSMIVSKDLATLGYNNERRGYLNANHRDICKYATPSDPNYLAVRNALASAIEGLRSHFILSKTELHKEEQRLLHSLLSISDVPEDDLMGVEELRIKGSCEWLMKKKTFQHWRDSTSTQMYWISSKPGMGKSVLSGYIINHLQELKRDCVYYFFTHSDNMKSNISSFLESLAWQMALLHPKILKTVLEVCHKNDQLNQMDYRIIWRKLYVDGILRIKLDQIQYWVIDGLDECKSETELVPLLLKVEEMSSIKIIVTSRNHFESYKKFHRPKITVVSEEILPDDIKPDILIYLFENMDHMPSRNDEARQNMVTEILEKSGGCFLWVRLVLHELGQVHTSAETRQVLNEVPSDMDELYSRALDSMSEAQYGKPLIKAILTWTVCSARPLTVHEMHYALQLDINDSFDSIQKSIKTGCNQLVYVDAQSQVQIIHQTARDFLLQPNITSEFAIDKKHGHKRLAMTCLHYLNGTEMRPPKNQKLSISNVVKKRSSFVNYACNSLFEHIPYVSSTDDDVLIMLAKFLSSPNALSWIEYIAGNSDLNRLIQAGKALKNYLQKRLTHMALLGKEVALLDFWATDLIRLVTKFGKNLLASPTSIFQLIPPFCPPETAFRKQFAAFPRGIVVLGLSATAWDDCLSTIIYHHEQTSALACSNNHFAVGFKSGKIIVYDEVTCQEAQTLQHQERVKILHFGEAGKVLVSSGEKKICIWEMGSWLELWSFDISHQSLSFMLTEDDRLLLAALSNNQLMSWDLTTGLLRDCADWTKDFFGQNDFALRRPTAAAFSVELKLLAVVYRGRDILLWDVELEAIHETYGKYTGARVGRSLANTTVSTLIFNPAPGATLLAAAYSDGDLVLFDTSDGMVKQIVTANAHYLACSSDGRTLASGHYSGTIQLFEFETLNALYSINPDDLGGMYQLCFSGDGRRLLDIAVSQCRVWDPIVLLREDTVEAIDTVSVSTLSIENKMGASNDPVLINALAYDETGEVFYCGKENGSIFMFETKSGHQSQKLFCHTSNSAIKYLHFDDESHILSSLDVSNQAMAHKLTRQREAFQIIKVFDHHVGEIVRQLLSNKGNTRMLVCSPEKDTLWSIMPDGNTIENTISWDNRDSFIWGSHPSNQHQLILIADNVVHLYEWQTLQRLTSTEGIPLQGPMLEPIIKFITPCFNGEFLATMFVDSLRSRPESRLLIWNTRDFDVKRASAVPVPEYQCLAGQVKCLIGGYGQRLVFLHHNGWICSTMQDTSDVECVRHFFVPADWLSTSDDLIIKVTRLGDILFVRRHEVAVIRRGLAHSE